MSSFADNKVKRIFSPVSLWKMSGAVVTCAIGDGTEVLSHTGFSQLCKLRLN